MGHPRSTVPGARLSQPQQIRRAIGVQTVLERCVAIASGAVRLENPHVGSLFGRAAGGTPAFPGPGARLFQAERCSWSGERRAAGLPCSAARRTHSCGNPRGTHWFDRRSEAGSRRRAGDNCTRAACAPRSMESLRLSRSGHESPWTCRVAHIRIDPRNPTQRRKVAKTNQRNAD